MGPEIKQNCRGKKETTLRGKTKEYKKKNSKHNSASTLHTYDN